MVLSRLALRQIEFRACTKPLTASFRSLAWALWVAIFLALPLSARAGNDDGILLGNDAALTGGAVVSTVNDGSALWYNPAGLAMSTKDSVDVGASAFALRRYNMPGLISADGGSGGDASFTEIVSIPSALTYVRRFSTNTVGGLALFASEVSDYSLRTSLTVPIGTVIDGTFRSIDGEIKVLVTQETARYHLAAGLASKLSQAFAFGASLFGDYYDESGLSQGTGTYHVLGVPVGANVNSVYAQSKVLGLHLRAGLVYQATAKVRLGLSVQTPGIYLYTSGRVTTFESATAPDASGQFVLETMSADHSVNELSFGLYSPLRVRLGGSYEFAGGTLSLEGDLQSPVQDDEIGVDRRTTWNVRAGARFAVSESIHLGAGLFTDRGAERTDDWGAGNLDFYGATVGGQYDNVRWLASDDKNAAGSPQRAGLTFSSTIALRYAYGTGKLVGQSLQAPDFDAFPQAVDLNVHEITLHLGSGVYF